MSGDDPNRTALPKSIGPSPTPLIIASIFSTLAIVAVVLRFYCRRMTRQRLMWDDWIILPALLFALAQAAILVANACNGDLGKHQPLDSHGLAIPSPKLELFQKLEYFSFLTFVPALFFAKLSILHLYIRLFQVDPGFRIAVFVMYAINIAWGFAFWIGYMFKCWPIQDYWMTANLEGHCLPNSFNYAFAFSNVILDLAILLMPLPMIWSLRMVWRQKLAVSGIFMLGSTVVILSIAKAVAFFYTFVWVEHNNDIMYDEAPLFYFSVPEALVAVVSACLPTMKPLFHRVFLPITSSLNSASYGASTVADKAVIRVTNTIDLSSRGIPMRKDKSRNCASPNGLGRERGLLVSRDSMAGGVMWDRFTRQCDENAELYPWKRNTDYMPEYRKDEFALLDEAHAAAKATPSSSSLDEESIIGGSQEGSASGFDVVSTATRVFTPSLVRAPSPLGVLAWQASMYREPQRPRVVRAMPSDINLSTPEPESENPPVRPHGTRYAWR